MLVYHFFLIDKISHWYLKKSKQLIFKAFTRRHSKDIKQLRGRPQTMSVGGEGGSPKDDLLHRPYLIKKTTRGVEGVKNRQF